MSHLTTYCTWARSCPIAAPKCWKGSGPHRTGCTRPGLRMFIQVLERLEGAVDQLSQTSTSTTEATIWLTKGGSSSMHLSFPNCIPHGPCVSTGNRRVSDQVHLNGSVVAPLNHSGFLPPQGAMELAVRCILSTRLNDGALTPLPVSPYTKDRCTP